MPGGLTLAFCIQGGRSNFFFFSSRRRHTRFDCDWSSDVCSSDLLQAQLDPGVAIEPQFDRALLALQGPAAAAVLARFAAGIDRLPFMSAAETTIAGAPAWVSRSGYTGEDGFELSLAAADAAAVAQAPLPPPPPPAGFSPPRRPPPWGGFIPPPPRPPRPPPPVSPPPPPRAGPLPPPCFFPPRAIPAAPPKKPPGEDRRWPTRATPRTTNG